MTIKYISCDCVTEVIEPIVKIEFFIHENGRVSLQCERHPDSEHYEEKHKIFSVDAERVEYIIEYDEGSEE